jgi:hypothetical protein
MTLSRAVATGAAVLGLGLSACSTGTPDAADTNPEEQSIAFGHVHGLGVNPADGRLFVASHMGVFRQTSDGFERVAGRWQDTMAFTVMGDDTFLASGHPDLRETDKPVHLGVSESTDAAETWSGLSLQGEANFHALEPAEDYPYGYDSNNGVLTVTRDKQRWADIARVTVTDLAVNPDSPEDLLVTDGRGKLLRLSQTEELRAVSAAPRLAFIDWPRPDLLVGVAPDGTVYRSSDSGRSWRRIAPVGSSPEALDATPSVWHVATEEGVFASTDDGRTWSPVSGQPGQS